MPGTLPDEKVLFLSDILPPAYQAVTNAGIGNGSSIAIYGAGPVGLLSAACARMLGADQIFTLDHHPYRLAYAQKTYGVIPINFDEDDDPADMIIRQTKGMRGVDGVVDAVGFEEKEVRRKQFSRHSSLRAVAARLYVSASPPFDAAASSVFLALIRGSSMASCSETHSIKG